MVGLKIKEHLPVLFVNLHHSGWSGLINIPKKRKKNSITTILKETMAFNWEKERLNILPV
jgi:hypothetical protein